MTDTKPKPKPFAGCDYCGKEPEGAIFFWRWDHKSESWMVSCSNCHVPPADQSDTRECESEKKENTIKGELK